MGLSKGSIYTNQVKENVNSTGITLKQIFKRAAFGSMDSTFPIFHKLKFPLRNCSTNLKSHWQKWLIEMKEFILL